MPYATSGIFGRTIVYKDRVTPIAALEGIKRAITMRFEVLEALNPLSRFISLETAFRRQLMF
jgi:hypothetical protein